MATGRILCALTIIIVCFVLWAAHSFIFVLRYLQNYEQTQIIRSTAERLELPSLLFCNKFPLTQTGLDRLGSSFNRPPVVEYLQQWLDPSLSSSPDAVPSNLSSVQSAESAISQQLLGSTFRERLDSVLISCIEMVSQCWVQGHRMESYECCSTHVETFIATTNGLCWLFHTPNLTHSAAGGSQQSVRIDFRISRTNYEPVTHRGMKVFVIPPHVEAIQMATQLRSSDGIPLRNRTGVSLTLSQKKVSHLERPMECGYSIGDAEIANSPTEETKYLECLLKQTIRSCHCVPLSVVLWVYRGDFSGQTIAALNATSICTVGDYEKCARSYLEFASPHRLSIPKSANSQLREDIQRCRNEFRPQCQSTEYSIGKSEYILAPGSSQTAGDLTMSVAFGFGDSEIIDEVRSQSPDLFDLISHFGYNLALWFCLGWMVWLLFSTSCCRERRPRTPPTKVVPIASSLSGGDSPISRPDSGERLVRLPPIQSARSIHDNDLRI